MKTGPWSALLCGASLLLAVPALAQVVPAGAELVVNTYTTGGQYGSAVAVDGKGNFVVVWQHRIDAGPTFDFEVRARRFDATGAGLGAEFAVNVVTTGVQADPAVACDRAGNFIVVWDSRPNPTGPEGVFGRRFASSGVPQGGEFQLASAYQPDLRSPVVVAAPDGTWLVAWQGRAAQGGSGADIIARRLAADGTPLGSDLLVNTYTTSFQRGPAATVDAAGTFTIVWQSDFADAPLIVGAVRGQRLDATGTRLGGEFRVNTVMPDSETEVAVGNAGSGFVVAWEAFRGDSPSDFGIKAQRFDGAGARVGSEFLVDTFTTSEQNHPSVAGLGGGGFLIAWDSFPQDGSSTGVFAQRYTGSGAPLGGEFRVNTYTTSYQRPPHAAADPAGNFIVTWDSVGPDGDGGGVAAQRYGGLQPSALAVDSAGNGVWEPGEAMDVRPSWRNVNGAGLTFTGGLSGLTGPAGATYTLTDGAGDYGTVANGAVGACTDCYAVSVSAPATRPAAHWDASALEVIGPAALGQEKRWLLHVGDSFTDVPRSGGTYRFVETLLHRGVTVGCATGLYCPTASTTREQMAVFLLGAKEGAGYTPVACGTPVFADVPASSPFCRWIEELARRAVTGGCGGGNYCPAQAVTREQMAVFVLRTLDPSLNPPACGTPVFNDVPASSVFCRWIEEMARRGITGGCGGGSYCPTQAVTREQMAVFLTTAFALTLYGV